VLAERFGAADVPTGGLGLENLFIRLTMLRASGQISRNPQG